MCQQVWVTGLYILSVAWLLVFSIYITLVQKSNKKNHAERQFCERNMPNPDTELYLYLIQIQQLGISIGFTLCTKTDKSHKVLLRQSWWRWWNGVGNVLLAHFRVININWLLREWLLREMSRPRGHLKKSAGMTWCNHVNMNLNLKEHLVEPMI